MALTPSYENSTTLKKLNVNGSIYWLKDNDLRKLVESFGQAVFKDVDTVVTEDSVNLVTSGAVYDAIKEAIADLPRAMHFRGVIERQTGETDAQAIARVITNPRDGDVVIMKDNGKEYIYGDSKWNELGDEGIYLTKADAASTYVPKTRTIAGIDLADDITVGELEAPTALDLKALAHKASASGTVEVFDNIDSITVAKADTYTVSGTAVAVPATYSALDVTPAGTVGITQTTNAAATYDKVKDITVSATSVGEGQTANYIPSGSITLPNFTASLSLAEDEVATVTDAGTAYTLTDGNVVKGNDTIASFAKKSLNAVINGSDPEQLDLVWATASDTGFFADAVTATGAVTYTKPTLSGSLPTFGTKDVVIKTGSTASAEASGTATFTGTGVVLGATNTFETVNATVTQPAFSGSFSGTKKSVTPTVATTTSAAPADAKVTVGTETVAITANKKNVTVTVE